MVVTCYLTDIKVLLLRKFSLFSNTTPTKQLTALISTVQVKFGYKLVV